MDEILDGKWMDVKGNYWGGGTYHNTVLVYLIKEGIFDFPIHFNKTFMDESLEGKMDGWMDVKGNYWGGTYLNTVLAYLIKGRDFNFLTHFNKLLWMKACMGKWMNGWM
jgi:hypothetical protein